MNMDISPKHSSTRALQRLCLKVIATILICSVICGGLFYMPGGKIAYAINDGGDSVTVYSEKDNVTSALQQAGIALDSGDEYTYETSGSSVIVTVVRAQSVNIVCDGITRNLLTFADTVEEIIEEAEVILGEDDVISRPLSARIYDGMTLFVTRGIELCPELSAASGQADFLAVPDIEPDAVYSGDAYLSFENSPLESADLTTYRSPEQAEAEAYEKAVAEAKAVKNDKSLTLAERAAAARFLSGATAELRMESAPLTNESGEAIDFDGNVLSYSKKLDMIATAYCFDSSPNDTTASGVVPYIGTVAMDLSVLPLGTKVYVTSADGSWVYGYSVVEDTGVRGRIIDLFMDTYDECINFGARNCVVYVLD